jgi:CheY-like chemotaxis protein
MHNGDERDNVMVSPDVEKALRGAGRDVPRCDRVLLVDDEQENLDVLSAVLEDRWTVVSAHDGVEALDLFTSKGPFDVVIADQRMPRMMGVELLTRIAADAPETIRIVLTAYSDVAPMMEALDRGLVYRFMLKPYDADEVRAIVADAMRLKASTAAIAALSEALVERRNKLAATLDSLQRTQGHLVATERVATLGKLVAGIVHDLNNHAFSFSLLLEEIRKSGRPALEQAAERAWRAFADHLELLRLVHGYARACPIEARIAAVPAETFVEKTIRVSSLQADRRSRRVVPHIHPGVEVIRIDETQLRQALVVLLENITESCSDDASVLLELLPAHGGDLCVQVSEEVSAAADTSPDDGATRGRTAQPTRLELGIEIAQMVAASHGGQLEVHHVPGRGTRAMLVLPGALRQRGEDG